MGPEKSSSPLSWLTSSILHLRGRWIPQRNAHEHLVSPNGSMQFDIVVKAYYLHSFYLFALHHYPPADRWVGS
ncbi:hypothetical protein AAHC03_09618 [Spirometra sp. Aus1]